MYLDIDQIPSEFNLIHKDGLATHIHSTSTIISEDKILVCCSNSIFCINLPSLELNWIKEFDPFTCFQIYKITDGFICHGELIISRFNIKGDLIWEFGGEDVFVSIEDTEEFNIVGGVIQFRDFANTFYKLDYNGVLLAKENNT